MAKLFKRGAGRIETMDDGKDADEEKQVRIGIDCDGGEVLDEGTPAERIARVIPKILREEPNLELVLAGNEAAIQTALADSIRQSGIIQEQGTLPRVEVLPSTVYYTHDDHGVVKSGTSLSNLADAFKAGKVDAVMSLGNTANFMRSAGRRIKRLLPAMRCLPPLVTQMPMLTIREGEIVNQNYVAVDVGGAIPDTRISDYSKALEDLARTVFVHTIMATTYARELVLDGRTPRVGVLAGSRRRANDPLVERVAELFNEKLDSTDLGAFLEYKGTVIPNDVLRGAVDVVVADGFVGNVYLKCAQAGLMYTDETFRRMFSVQEMRAHAKLKKYFELAALLLPRGAFDLIPNNIFERFFPREVSYFENQLHFDGEIAAPQFAIMPSIDGSYLLGDLGEMPAVSGNEKYTEVIDRNARHVFLGGLRAAMEYVARYRSKLPRIGLISNGAEENKGNAIVRRVDELFRQEVVSGRDLHYDYLGYVEPLSKDRDSQGAVNGAVDILLADSYTARVFMKNFYAHVNGLATLIRHRFDQAGFKGRVRMMRRRRELKKVMHDIRAKVDPSKYAGAFLLGMNAVLVKCHGGTNIDGIYHGIRRTLQYVDSGINTKVVEDLKGFL